MMPNEITIDGVKYVRADRFPDRLSIHAMYDCHLFRRLKGASIQAIVDDWLREVYAPDPELGRPSLCPVIVMEGDKEIRRVGEMAHAPRRDDQDIDFSKWLEPVRADPDIARLLASQSIYSPEQ